VGSLGSFLTNTVSISSGAVDSTTTSCLTLGAIGSGVAIRLTWGESPSDLDSHLITPSGEHVYFQNFGNGTVAPFASLDVDDRSSFGPEVITITKLMVGTYRYYVRNFSGQSLGLFSRSAARVELFTPNRATELITVPTVDTISTNYWLPFEMDVDGACNITVRRDNILSTVEPVTPPSITTPVYCVRP
jgi:uncharacterized protein YfaP (DUF2135 family)